MTKKSSNISKKLKFKLQVPINLDFRRWYITNVRTVYVFYYFWSETVWKYCMCVPNVDKFKKANGGKSYDALQERWSKTLTLLTAANRVSKFNAHSSSKSSPWLSMKVTHTLYFHVVCISVQTLCTTFACSVFIIFKINGQRILL